MAPTNHEKHSKIKAFFKAMFLKFLKTVFEMKDKEAVTP